jgi:hypothetical protein
MDSEVRAVSFSYENEILGVGCQDGSIQLINTEDFSTLQTLKAHDT